MSGLLGLNLDDKSVGLLGMGMNMLNQASPRTAQQMQQGGGMGQGANPFGFAGGNGGGMDLMTLLKLLKGGGINPLAGMGGLGENNKLGYM